MKLDHLDDAILVSVDNGVSCSYGTTLTLTGTATATDHAKYKASIYIPSYICNWMTMEVSV